LSYFGNQFIELGFGLLRVSVNGVHSETDAQWLLECGVESVPLLLRHDLKRLVAALEDFVVLIHFLYALRAFLGFLGLALFVTFFAVELLVVLRLLNLARPVVPFLPRSGSRTASSMSFLRSA